SCVELPPALHRITHQYTAHPVVDLVVVFEAHYRLTRTRGATEAKRLANGSIRDRPRLVGPADGTDLKCRFECFISTYAAPRNARVDLAEFRTLSKINRGACKTSVDVARLSNCVR